LIFLFFYFFLIKLSTNSFIALLIFGELLF